MTSPSLHLLPACKYSRVCQHHWGLNPLLQYPYPTSQWMGPSDTVLSVPCILHTLPPPHTHPSLPCMSFPELIRLHSLIFPDSWYLPLSFKGCGAILGFRCLGRSRHEFFTHCFWDGPSGQWSTACSWKLWDSRTAFKDLASFAHSSSSYTQMASWIRPNLIGQGTLMSTNVVQGLTGSLKTQRWHQKKLTTWQITRQRPAFIPLNKDFPVQHR